MFEPIRHSGGMVGGLGGSGRLEHSSLISSGTLPDYKGLEHRFIHLVLTILYTYTSRHRFNYYTLNE